MLIKSGLIAAMLFMSSAANAAFYSATFSGAAENPANMSTATGFGTLRVTGTTLTVNIDFDGLSAGLAAGHIHCCAAPTGNSTVAIGFGGLPLGSTSGSIDLMFDLTQASIFTAGYITESGGTLALAQTRLLTALDNGEVYFNLHNANFPGGEIRGNLTSVPEPASWAMLVMGFGLAGAAMRRRGFAIAA